VILDELGDYLESHGVGVQNTSIFLGNIPDVAQDPVVAIFEYPGLPIERTHTTKYDKTRIQVQVRSKSYPTGRQKITDVFNILDTIENQVIDGVRYQAVQGLQAPSFLSRDELNRIIFVFNAQVTKEFS
jgi:hypothetical protein